MTSGDEFGPHLTIDARGCNKEKITNMNFIYEFLNNFPEAIGMQKMSLPAVVPWKDEWAETPGISGFVMITTSHISIHTFPEDDYVFIDVFSCRPFDVEKTKNLILEMFEAKTADVNVVKRGLQFRKKQTIMPETN